MLPTSLMTEKRLQRSNQQQPSQTTGARRDGRLCRIVNVANGALLDIETGKDTNFIIGSPASSAAIKSWRIIAMGSGYGIRTAEDVVIPRYLAPTDEGIGDGKQLGLSTFPTTWDLCERTDEFKTGDEIVLPDVIEEWTCTIRWAFARKSAHVLDLEAHGRGTKVRFQPFRQPQHERCQYWRIQYLDETPVYTPIPYTSPPAVPAGNPSNRTSGLGLESGGKYVLYNVESSTVLDKAGRDNTRVHGFECGGYDSQKWEVLERVTGWVLRNVKNRGYLSIDQEPNNGIKAITTVSDRIIWDIRPQELDESGEKGVYRLLLKDTNYALSLAGFGSSKNDTDIILWQSWHGRSQLWRFEKAG